MSKHNTTLTNQELTEDVERLNNELVSARAEVSTLKGRVSELEARVRELQDVFDDIGKLPSFEAINPILDKTRKIR